MNREKGRLGKRDRNEGAECGGYELRLMCRGVVGRGWGKQQNR